jgi:hypothetical protein
MERLMAELRLAKLPERTPVRVTISLPPELKRSLDEYAALYREVYGQAEPVEALVPAMLGAFLEADRSFARRCRGGKR